MTLLLVKPAELLCCELEVGCSIELIGCITYSATGSFAALRDQDSVALCPRVWPLMSSVLVDGVPGLKLEPNMSRRWTWLKKADGRC